MLVALRVAAVLTIALLVGAQFAFGFVLAPYLFALAGQGDELVPHTGAAAGLIGPLLHGLDAALLAVVPPLLFALFALRSRGAVPAGGRWYLSETVLVLAALVTGVNYFVLAPRVQGIKAELAAKYGAYHLADRADPLMADFGAAHGGSTALFVTTFALGVIVLACLVQFRDEQPSQTADPSDEEPGAG